MASRRSCSTSGSSTTESSPREGVVRPPKGSKRKRNGKLCQHPGGCTRFAQGATNLCIGHGGGRRCQFPGCPRSAVGRSNKCVTHGGGRRCEFTGCSKSARGSTGFCFAHGGGARCRICGCGRVAHRSTGLCVNHGAGRECDYPLCKKLAPWPSMYCQSHQTIVEPSTRDVAESISTEATECCFYPSLALEDFNAMDCDNLIDYFPAGPDVDDDEEDSPMESIDEVNGDGPLLDFLACCSGRGNITDLENSVLSSTVEERVVSCALSARSLGTLGDILARFDEFLEH
ncbi:hypothetical protein Pmar_PMAR002195 [Perkinsus marinus ATCC 50983]|uniref:WRKY19-like zinc finger domain-containing protein n=2 Tax=Perkinsus marinus (strain ATCC 50983 / TXsc) TaxID=423536 RepID=C5L8W8_PERM5|nr:hypothetical protein Pmar_PMAR002195 [Perkinsus marinus ATCC 50983]EER06826.1 hypothetical protein Pmar_PMAR002195 [Perkinsus marinus ATCC 50983]|eukprot:XP_002775010.1 hypothetical protein Pmar_PMAR002195 [Perkinsus marinus ATCC 50983]